METSIKIIWAVCILYVFASCQQPGEIKVGKQALASEEVSWKSELSERLNLFGHRNWIVVADAAYPQQSNPAIETISIDADHLEAVRFVSNLISKAPHVDANVFIDEEMAFVSEENANGIGSYRKDLLKIIQGELVKPLPHEDIIKELDASAELFNILILKTDLTIPYTSVFFRLECGYWNTTSEESLRAAMKADEGRR